MMQGSRSPASFRVASIPTNQIQGVRLPPEDDIILRKDAYQSLARVREIQRVAAGLQSPLLAGGSSTVQYKEPAIKPGANIQAYENRGAVYLAQLEQRFAARSTSTDLENIPKLPRKKLKLKTKRRQSKSAGASPPSRVPIISVNGSAVLPGERTGSGLPPPEAVNIQPPDQTKTISTMPNFVQSQVVKSDVTLQQRPNSPFTLRQRPNSPSTLRQRPVSPSAQRQRPVSPSTLRHRPISPKLSANFTSPIKIYPIHNNKTEGFCQELFTDQVRDSYGTMQDVYGRSSPVVGSNDHPANYSANTQLKMNSARPQQAYEKSTVQNSVHFGIRKVVNVEPVPKLENDLYENGLNQLEDEMREKTSRLTENALFNAQKELEVLLQRCDDVCLLPPELLTSCSLVTLQLLSTMLQNNIQETRQLSPGETVPGAGQDGNSTDLWVIVDHRRKRESKLGKLEPLLRLVEDMWRMRELYILPGGQIAVSTAIQHRIQKILLQLHTLDLLLVDRKLAVNLGLIHKELLEMRWRKNEENGGSGLKKGEEEKSSGIMLKNEIIKIDSRIKQIYEEVEDLGTSLSIYQHELLLLRQELQKAAQLSMVKPRGDLSCPSSEQVLAVENGLKQVQSRAVGLHSYRQDLLAIREMRKSPSFSDIESFLQQENKPNSSYPQPYLEPTYPSPQYDPWSGTHRVGATSPSQRVGSTSPSATMQRDPVHLSITTQPPNWQNSASTRPQEVCRRAPGTDLYSNGLTRPASAPIRGQEITSKDGQTNSRDCMERLLKPSDILRLKTQNEISKSMNLAISSTSIVRANPVKTIPSTQNEVVLSYPGRLDVEAVQKGVDDSQRSRDNTGASPENSSTFHHFPSEIPFGNLESKSEGKFTENWFNLNNTLHRSKEVKSPEVSRLLSHQFQYTGKSGSLDKFNSMSSSCQSLPPYLERPCSAASTCSNQSEEEMIALIDQMTNHMFDTEQGNKKDDILDRRTNSLPRNPRNPENVRPNTMHNLPGGSSFQSKRLNSLGRKDGNPSAYERLFGKENLSMKDFQNSVQQNHSLPKRKVPIFIQKAGRRKEKLVDRNCSLLPVKSKLTSSSPSLINRSCISPGADYCPDYVKSSQHTERKLDSSCIDGVLGAPDKIHIPQRYIPEQEENVGEEERRKKMEKVENIKKMLGCSDQVNQSLSLNQIIAKQVMQRSRRIAADAARSSVVNPGNPEDDEDDLSDSSPDVPLPLRQQRESFLI
ncbi:uncharacterized protein LOC111713888 isoform X3 [Eurytemora carolleeae]|uniref:uncharacterized protein LOC111713888 isoform X3 n=1 Tax=Eurytemora carolleeae TaxID=1294199 RepID=UPI000C7756B4|nr:uncharacterized protein LOC111713888 isoform X3 [Eurytemora carolleeae]|eukprot:XP_023344640.1 uncharacterized protein LOC111713888 isoform X3 [Eurytemora affinis]